MCCNVRCGEPVIQDPTVALRSGFKGRLITRTGWGRSPDITWWRLEEDRFLLESLPGFKGVVYSQLRQTMHVTLECLPFLFTSTDHNRMLKAN